MSSREMFSQPEPRRRSPLAALLSLVAHAAGIAVAAWFAYMQVTRPPIRPDQTLTFLRVNVPDVPLDAIEPLREMPPPEPILAQPEPEPEVIAELPPLPEPAAPGAPPPPPPPAPKRPEVKVGEFAAAPVAAPRADPRQVQAVGFDAQQAIAPEMRLRATEVGIFESGTDAGARPGTDRPQAAVIASGFDRSQPDGPAARAPRTVASSGFGSTPDAQARAARPAAVKPTGFADPQPATPATTPRAQERQDVTPVEVIAKPTPAYSEEARALRIEGEVTLEVEFSASGQVRVLRIIRGLGHGLDEMATRAAERIRFKPAHAAGRPVDFRTNVQIVFRLT